MKLTKEILIALGITGAGALSAENLTREQIDKMLEELVAKPTQRIVRGGLTREELRGELMVEREVMAMCYRNGPPRDYSPYFCPTCQTRTLHTSGYAETGLYRQQVKRINELGLNVKLYESAMCSQCSKDKTKKPSVYLEVRTGDRVKRTKLRDDDLPKLIAFLEGQDTYMWPNDDTERGLRYEVGRIGELLGIEDAHTLFNRLLIKDFKKRQETATKKEE